jgi:hypothetical protein
MIFINFLLDVKKSFRILAAVCLLVPAAAMGAKGNTDRPAQPNVILLLVDDLGWQDVKCYDIDEPSPMETPNMDTLATQGVLFRQAYSAGPVCAPSRAAILSGIHPARAQHVGVGGGNPPNPHNRTGSRMIKPGNNQSICIEATGGKVTLSKCRVNQLKSIW